MAELPLRLIRRLLLLRYVIIADATLYIGYRLADNVDDATLSLVDVASWLLHITRAGIVVTGRHDYYARRYAIDTGAAILRCCQDTD